MHEIKSFKIFQTAKVIGVLYAILGFIEGATFAILIAYSPHPHPDPHPLPRPLVILIGGPILFGVVGFIFTTIICWLYNIVAARLGGIAFELTPRSEN